MDRRLQLHFTPSLWPMSWPMGLTFLRLLLLPLFLWFILVDANHEEHAHRWWAVGVFGVMAITDKLDGYLARRLNQATKLGAVLDPLADKLLVACSVILLSFEWVAPAGFRIPEWVVIAVYGKDLIIAIGAVTLLALVGHVDVVPRPLGKVSTVLQLALVIAVLIAPAKKAAWFGWWKGFVVALWWMVAIIAIAACLDYIIQGVRQFAAARRARVATVVDENEMRRR